VLRGRPGGAAGGAAGGAPAAGRGGHALRQGEVGLTRRLAAGAVLLAAAVLVFVLWPTPVAAGIRARVAAAGRHPPHARGRGLRLRYVRKGSGPPLLLLHGFSSSIYTWKDALPRLAARHDVVAMDLPGFGDSTIPERLDGEVEVRAVLGLLDRLGLARASIAGNTLGGAPPGAAAAREPGPGDRPLLRAARGHCVPPPSPPRA